MSTRGLIGFRYKENDKLCYNHENSQYHYLGKNLVRELKKLTPENLLSFAPHDRAPDPYR